MILEKTSDTLNILSRIRQQLKEHSTIQTRKGAKRFFKEKDGIKLYGVKTAVVHQLSKNSFKEIKDLPKAEIFALCEDLWKSGFLEETFIAADWVYFLRKQYEPADFNIFEKWIDKYVTNWASCDSFCNHPVGTLMEMFPELLPELKRWANSPNLWMRRAAAVSLVVPARKGKFLPEIMDIADILVSDTEDLVQKGYGWALKEASKKHQMQVFDYIMNYKTEMGRTALRYAIEKMPRELRAKAMEK